MSTLPPTILSSLTDFTGYIVENSPEDTMLLNAGRNKFLQLSATDPDRVNFVFSCIFISNLKLIFPIEDTGYYLIVCKRVSF